jgi:hypothetical protein
MMKPRDYGTTKEIVARLVHEIGPKRVGFLLGVSGSSIYGYCDPDCSTQATFDQVRRLTDASKFPNAAEDLAMLAGGVFMPVAPCDAALMEIAAQSAQQHGEFISSLILAMRDGTITDKEARDVLAHLDELLRVVVSMRAKIAAMA